MRVLCLVPYPTLGASNRLRVEQYAPLLRDEGVHLEVSPFLDDATYRVLYVPGHARAKLRAVLRGFLRRIRDVQRAASYDLVLVHREAAPVGPPLVERALARRSVPYVLDFDDAIFLRAVHPANRRWAWLRDPSRVMESARLARAVVVGNEYLAARAREWNADVTVIPTPVDADRHQPRPRSRRSGSLLLGWVGSSTTAPYLRLLDAPLREVARRRDIVLRVVGGEYTHPDVRVEARPYDLVAEPDEIAEFDIGLLPEPDDEWTRGKGAFKALLYMATAVPVVASRVGVNPDVVGDGISGVCVDGASDWAEAIERLGEDSALRERMGAAGRARVEELYSLRVQAPRLAKVLLRAAGSTAA